jgi:hypothetical protein
VACVGIGFIKVSKQGSNVIDFDNRHSTLNMSRSIGFTQPTHFTNPAKSYNSSEHKEYDFHCFDKCSKTLPHKNKTVANDILMQKIIIGPNTHLFYDRG